MNRKINSKILNMLSWPVFAVSQSPYRINPEQPENIFYADPCFKIRLGHRGHSPRGITVRPGYRAGFRYSYRKVCRSIL